VHRKDLMNPNSTCKPWVMLVMRSALFLAFQSLIALGFRLTGSPNAWASSAAYWPWVVILADLVCLALLIHFYRREGSSFWNVFRLERQYVKQDLWFLFGFLLARENYSRLKQEKPEEWSRWNRLLSEVRDDFRRKNRKQGS